MDAVQWMGERVDELERKWQRMGKRKNKTSSLPSW